MRSGVHLSPRSYFEIPMLTRVGRWNRAENDSIIPWYRSALEKSIFRLHFLSRWQFWLQIQNPWLINGMRDYVRKVNNCHVKACFSAWWGLLVTSLTLISSGLWFRSGACPCSDSLSAFQIAAGRSAEWPTAPGTPLAIHYKWNALKHRPDWRHKNSQFRYLFWPLFFS